MRERQSGFMNAIGGDARFEVLESVSGDFLRSKGAECMRYLLDKYGAKGIDVVYSHNDSMTLGALGVHARSRRAGDDHGGGADAGRDDPPKIMHPQAPPLGAMSSIQEIIEKVGRYASVGTPYMASETYVAGYADANYGVPTGSPIQNAHTTE